VFLLTVLYKGSRSNFKDVEVKAMATVSKALANAARGATARWRQL